MASNLISEVEAEVDWFQDMDMDIAVDSSPVKVKQEPGAAAAASSCCADASRAPGCHSLQLLTYCNYGGTSTF